VASDDDPQPTSSAADRSVAAARPLRRVMFMA
jgi:hypothetical protein